MANKKTRKIPLRRLRRAGVDIFRIPMLGHDCIIETFIKKVDLQKYNIRIFNAGDVPVDQIKKAHMNSYIVFGKHSEEGFLNKTYTDFIENGINPGRYHRHKVRPGCKLHEVAKAVFPDVATLSTGLVSDNPVVAKAAETLIDLALSKENGYEKLLGDKTGAEKHSARTLYVYDLNDPETALADLVELIGIEEPVELIANKQYEPINLSEPVVAKLKKKVKKDFDALGAVKPIN